MNNLQAFKIVFINFSFFDVIIFIVKENIMRKDYLHHLITILFDKIIIAINHLKG